MTKWPVNLQGSSNFKGDHCTKFGYYQTKESLDMEHITYGQFNCKEINELTSLRWYGTPCNIFMDERVLKYDYDQGFKNVKIYNICPKNAFTKYHKKD